MKLKKGNPLVEAQILGAVTPIGTNAVDIWRKVDTWSTVTVRNYLTKLAIDGKIERYMVPAPQGGGHGQWMYKTLEEKLCS